MIDDLNDKSLAKNQALAEACGNLSSSQCNALRKDLDNPIKSYNEKLSPDDPYYNYLQTKYKDQYDGSKEISSLQFDLAVKDVEAYREYRAQMISETYGFSIETSRKKELIILRCQLRLL